MPEVTIDSSGRYEFKKKRAMRRDLTGKLFGRLTVLQLLGKTSSWKRNVRVWKCKCSCGNITNVYEPALLYAKPPTQSCGCLSRELAAERLRVMKIAKKGSK